MPGAARRGVRRVGSRGNKCWSRGEPELPRPPPDYPSARGAWSKSGGGRGAEPQARLGRGCGRGLPLRPAELELPLDKVGPGGWARARRPRPAASSCRCGRPVFLRFLRGPCGVCSFWPSSPLPGSSLPRPPHLPALLSSSPTFSPARPPLFLLSQGEGSDTLGPRCTPRWRCGPGRWGSGACGVLPRPRTAPGSGAAGADQVFVSRWRQLSTRALPQAAGTVTSGSPKTGFCETSGEPFVLTSKKIFHAARVE